MTKNVISKGETGTTFRGTTGRLELKKQGRRGCSDSDLGVFLLLLRALTDIVMRARAGSWRGSIAVILQVKKKPQNEKLREYIRYAVGIRFD